MTLSLAGRTQAPGPQPVPVRSGGFGGAEGLARYLAAEGIGLLVDATHPFARQISRNAGAAAGIAGVPLLILERPPWRAGAGDRWTAVPDMAAAAAALGETPRSVFLAIGRQEAGAFRAAPQHRYLLRVIDPPEPGTLPGATILAARGPFDEAEEGALLLRHGIEVVVAKNSGGAAGWPKLAAARALGLPVVLVDRAETPGAAASVEEMLHRIAHLAAPSERGV